MHRPDLFRQLGSVGLRPPPGVAYGPGQARLRVRGYPSSTSLCFYAFAAFCVLPFFDIPLLGLSFTAPLFLIVAYKIALRPLRPWFPTYQSWILLAAALWAGLLLGFILNSITSQVMGSLLIRLRSFVRFSYWILVFLGSLYFISAARAQTKVAKVLAICVTLLAALRWFEAVALGKVAAWSSTLFQTQNNYALLFTAFSPFLLVFVVSARPLYRAAAALALVMVWGAAAINGSRGSWVAMAAGICLFLVLFTVAKPKRSWGLWGAVAVIVVVLASILLSSPRAANAISSRFSTFSSLDADKSFQARQYLNRRSWVLFRDSPVFGVGLGLYNQVAAPVEVPEWYKGHEDQFDRKSSHNSYLSFLAETGLVGALPFCDMLVVLLVPGMLATVRLAKRGHMWALGAFVGLFSMAIHMWVISALTNTATWFVYGFAGTVIIAAREERRLRALVGRKQGTFGGSGSGRTNSQRSPAL